MQYPDGKRHESGHPAQFASENPYKFKELCDKIRMPKLTAPLVYCKI